MSSIKKFSGFLSRICISLIFLIGGIGKLTSWSATEQFITDVFVEWHTRLSQIEGISSFLEKIIPYSNIIMLFFIALEILGGISLILNYKVKWGAFLLIIFLIPVTLFVHHFWWLDGDKRSLEMIMFLKNLAIFGGILNLLVFGPGDTKSSSTFDE